MKDGIAKERVLGTHKQRSTEEEARKKHTKGKRMLIGSKKECKPPNYVLKQTFKVLGQSRPLNIKGRLFKYSKTNIYD